jgi:hypothetical protein
VNSQNGLTIAPFNSSSYNFGLNYETGQEQFDSNALTSEKMKNLCIASAISIVVFFSASGQHFMKPIKQNNLNIIIEHNIIPKTLKYNTKELDSNKANLNLFPINEYLNNNMSIIGFNSDNNLMGGVNTEKMNKNVKKIKEYASFKEDWNGYGAEPFSPKLLEFSEYIIRNLKIQPEIFPTGRQSIQLEYEQDSGRYLEFEIFENSINMLYIDENGNEEIKVLENKIEEINKVVSRFYE